MTIPQVFGSPDLRWRNEATVQMDTQTMPRALLYFWWASWKQRCANRNVKGWRKRGRFMKSKDRLNAIPLKFHKSWSLSHSTGWMRICCWFHTFWEHSFLFIGYFIAQLIKKATHWDGKAAQLGDVSLLRKARIIFLSYKPYLKSSCLSEA